MLQFRRAHATQQAISYQQYRVVQAQYSQALVERSIQQRMREASDGFLPLPCQVAIRESTSPVKEHKQSLTDQVIVSTKCVCTYVLVTIPPTPVRNCTWCPIFK